MTNNQRPFGAAPRPPRASCRNSDESWLLGSRAFYEKVNSYWTDRAADRAANPKQSPQARKRLTNKK